MLIDNKYDLKGIVYLLTDTDQYPRMIVGVKVCVDGALLYQVVCGTSETWHYEVELSAEKDLITSF